MFAFLTKKKKRKLIASLAACAALSLFACATPPSAAFAAGIRTERNWTTEPVEHKGFKDLGHYIIELPDYTDAAVDVKGRAAFNAVAERGDIPKFGCTAMGKKNSKGEVVIGRNFDLDISQSAAYLFRTTYGKYKTAGVSYLPNFKISYAEVQKLDDLDEDFKSMIPFFASDCMNEKGLYIQSNLRERTDALTCYGTHSARGEKTRDDGTPWSDLRACTISLVYLVAENCATVDEAIAFVKNSYDWYTVGTMPGAANNNMSFMIGDATGQFGVIEIAQDEVVYLPYQYGHANFYLHPRWRSIETCGAGEGRLAKVAEVLRHVETLEDAMESMKPIMWRNETLWLGESHRAKDAAHPNPWNQIVFQDDQGNPQLDWRNEYVAKWPVLDDGRMLIPAQMYEDAKNSTHDPMIKKYFDEAVATGRMIIDDGSITFAVNGEDYTLTELMENPAKDQALSDEYSRLQHNEDVRWINDDHNFEALKAAAYASLHIRYNNDGVFDNSCLSKYEKLLAFYGYGVEKDETPLRDDGTIWTTSVNVGANCAQKEMKIRFWENDDLIYHLKF